MVRLKINGLFVDFPYQPYPAQIVTISKLIASLKDGGSAIIESPTGTGKSLSILCGAMAYNEYLSITSQPTIPIYVCSRTHKQLDNLVDQLKKSRYRPRIAILASREQYCINSKVRHEFDKNKACGDARKTNSCLFFNGKEKLQKRVETKLYDIEEFKIEGKKCGGCPYYAARILKDKSDIIFAPYNYIVDKGIREAMSINLTGAIVIIDEAHNIEDVCRQSGSIEIKSRNLEFMISELYSLAKSAGDSKEPYLKLVSMLQEILKYAESELNFEKKTFYESKRIKRGKAIKAEVELMGITPIKLGEYFNALNTILADEDEDHSQILQFFDSFLAVLNRLMTEDCTSYGYALIKNTTNKYEKSGYTINFWLLDASVIFKLIEHDCKSIVLLSGTLVPFEAVSEELGVDFRHKCEAPHVLDNNNMLISQISYGHLSTELMGTYAIAESFDYLDQIVHIITTVTVALETKGGVLVFVPSYNFLENLIKRMKIPHFKESQSDFTSVLASYKRSIDQKKPSVLICVYRGKASEGMDFKDNFARSVIAVSIPYPNLKDTQVELKRERANKSWYEVQAYKAISQALGRVIRHKDDWGTVFLLDARYQQKKVTDKLSKWVRENVVCYRDFEECRSEFDSFINKFAN